MTPAGFELDIKYPGIQNAQHDGEAICLNDFMLVANDSRATYEGVEQSLTDTDVVDVTPLENGNIQVGCKVASCGLKVLIEPGKRMLPSNSCHLMTQACSSQA